MQEMGGNQHPTQTLTDLLTIKSLKRKFRKSYNWIMWRLKKWKNSTFFSKSYV